METNQTLFLNYSPIRGFSVQTYRNSGWTNDSITGFMADISTGVLSNIDLTKAKEGLLVINISDYPQEDREEITEILSSISEAIEGH